MRSWCSSFSSSATRPLRAGRGGAEQKRSRSGVAAVRRCGDDRVGGFGWKRRAVVASLNSSSSTDNPIRGSSSFSSSLFRARDGALSARKSCFFFGAKRELSVSVCLKTRGGRRYAHGVVTFVAFVDGFGKKKRREERRRRATTRNKTSMRDGEETNEDDKEEGDLNAINVTGKKIVSEDEDDEEFDLDAAFKEKFSKSKKLNEELPLPEGTIRIKAKSSSSRSSPAEKKKNAQAANNDLAFDPLAGSVDVSMDDFSYDPEQQRQMLLQERREKEEQERVEQAAKEEETNRKKKMATDGTVIRRVSKVAAMPLRSKVAPTGKPFGISAANEEALRAVKQKFSLRNLVSKKNENAQNYTADSNAKPIRVGTVIRKISKPARLNEDEKESNAQKALALITSQALAALSFREQLLNTLKDSTLGDALAVFDTLWQSFWIQWRSRLENTAKWVFFASTALTAMCHYVVGPGMIGPRLPQIGELASSVVGRPVRVGRCKLFSFPGILGFGPVLEVGPLVVGAETTGGEKSIVEVDTAKISYDLVRSITRRKIVAEVRLDGVKATLKQGVNQSWFGYPEDLPTFQANLPSARPSFNLDAVKKASASATNVISENKIASGPSVEIRTIKLERGVAALHMAGDPQPRNVKNLSATMRISPKGELDLDAKFNPISRATPPEQRQNTFIANFAARNLRGHNSDAEERSLKYEKSRNDNGGLLKVNVQYKNPEKNQKPMGDDDIAMPDLKVKVNASNTSAAFVDRCIPGLPIDMHAGRIDGEINILAKDQATWLFPEFSGELRGKHLRFHFYDATDDFADTELDLVFQKRRMYIHNGRGHYGHVPITVTGDLDLNPLPVKSLLLGPDAKVHAPRGEYRLSGQIAPVEAHALRETLGVRPPPRPLAGALKGFLYVSGPLEAPVFTGQAETTDFIPEENAKGFSATMEEEKAWSYRAVKKYEKDGAVAAYDRVPIRNVKATWTVEPKKDVFVLHSAEGQLVAGGKVRASGSIKINPDALHDPAAINVEATATDVDPRALARQLATTGFDNSTNNAKGNGEENSPSTSNSTTTDAENEIGAWIDRVCPPGYADATATIEGAHSGPKVKVDWTIDHDADVGGRVTIERKGITAKLKTPSIEIDADVKTEFPPLEKALAAVSVEDAIEAGKPAYTAAEIDGRANGFDLFDLEDGREEGGEVVSEKLRYVRDPDRVRLRVTGRTRVKGKFSTPSVAGGENSDSVATTDGKDGETAASDEEKKESSAFPSFEGTAQLDNLKLNKLELAPKLTGKVFASATDGLSLSAKGRSDESLSAEISADGKASAALRRGALRAGVEFGDFAGAFELAGLKLDDLELGSLRGRVDVASARLDLREKVGDGILRVEKPRLSGFTGDLAEGEVSWSGKTVKLHSATLEQARSRYEADGEYMLPDAVWSKLPESRVERQKRTMLEGDALLSSDVIDVDLVSGSTIEEETATTEPALAVTPSENETSSVVAAVAADAMTETKNNNNKGLFSGFFSDMKKHPAANLIKEQQSLSSPTTQSDDEINKDEEVRAKTPEEIEEEARIARMEQLEMQEQIDEDEDDAFDREEPQIQDKSTRSTSSSSMISSEYTEDGSVKPYISPFEERNGEIPLGSIASASTSQPLSYERDAWFQEKMNDAPSTDIQAAKKDRFSNVFKQFKPRNRRNGDSDGRNRTSSAPNFNKPGAPSLQKLPPMNPKDAPKSEGEWRFRLAVPSADVEEMLPAVRLFASLREESTPQEYGRAKEAFVNAISQASVISQDISRDVFDQLMDSREKKMTSNAAEKKKQRQNNNKKKRKSKLQRQRRTTEFIDVDDIDEDSADTEKKAVQLPGLQDLKGEWRGVVQASGNSIKKTSVPTAAIDEKDAVKDEQGEANGDFFKDSSRAFNTALSNLESSHPTSIQFDVSGENLLWGPHVVRKAEALGSANEKDGMKLERLEITSDAASLSAQGTIGGEVQDANFSLRDLPIGFLAEVFRPLWPSAFPRIDGNLLVQGHLGGSVEEPTGDVLVRLRDGKIGSTKLSAVEARALLNDQQRVEFDFEASPMTSASDGGSSGIVRASGIVPLPEADDQSLAVDAKVRDAGMCILCAAASGGTDNVDWQNGNADIALHARGTSENPVFDGVAEIRRAKIVSPFLAKPFAPINATVRIQRNTLYADDIEGRCGKGFVKIKGAIPVIQRRKSRGGETWDNLVARADTQAGLKVDIQGLDVRARNAYNGQVNAGLVLKGTISAPEVGGSIQLSKGQVTATPGQPEDTALSGAESGKKDVDIPGANGGKDDLLARIHREGKQSTDLASVLQRAAIANDPEAWAALEKARLRRERNLDKLSDVRFRGLKVQIGPEMSIVYPFVLNFGVSGEVTIDGAADAKRLRPSGVINFDRGDVNLVAAQVRLNREHPNRAVFIPENGLDPMVDVSLLGADVRALIQGQASEWSTNLVLSSATESASGSGGEGGGLASLSSLSPEEAARIFEGQLSQSLLERDGRIAFSSLASSTLASLMPKIEAGGNVGNARWRVTAAPSLPGLLSLDPGMDPFATGAQFTLGSEAEIAFGDSLQASMSRTLAADETQTETQFSLMYKLTKKLRMQLVSVSSAATRLLFEYTNRD